MCLAIQLGLCTLIFWLIRGPAPWHKTTCPPWLWEMKAMQEIHGTMRFWILSGILLSAEVDRSKSTLNWWILLFLMKILDNHLCFKTPKKPHLLISMSSRIKSQTPTYCHREGAAKTFFSNVWQITQKKTGILITSWAMAFLIPLEQIAKSKVSLGWIFVREYLMRIKEPKETPKWHLEPINLRETLILRLSKNS